MAVLTIANSLFYGQVNQTLAFLDADGNTELRQKEETDNYFVGGKTMVRRNFQEWNFCQGDKSFICWVHCYRAKA